MNIDLVLDDSRKVQTRRAGLTRNYPHKLLQSIRPPKDLKKEAPSEMPKDATTKGHASTNTSNISNSANDAKLKKSRKREDKGSDKENQIGSSTSSVMKNIVLPKDEEEDFLRMPYDSDDGPQFAGDSSDDESPSKVNANMTKTSFGAKNKKSTQASTTPPVPDRKSLRAKTSHSTLNTDVKRKNEESDSKHEPEVDPFGNMQGSSSKRKSYTETHKGHKRPRHGINNIPGKKSYGKNKTNTYSTKSTPTKPFQNYGGYSSPSLVGDDGKDKLQDYGTDTPTSIQSPIKGGFVRPEFTDDDLSDLDLLSKSQSSSALPVTQLQQLQRYGDDDDDDILGGAKELLKKLNAGNIVSLEGFEREESSDLSELDDYTGPRCPMCNEAVAAEDLEAFGEMNTRKQEKFCMSHQRKSARSDWKNKGYPEIDWATLDSRIAGHHAFIRKIIGGASCHSRNILDETIRAGKDRNLMKSTTNLIPGYFGSRGLRLMTENIMEKFTSKLKKRAPVDRLIAARGPTAFVESVIVPEVTVLLIKEDMNVDEEEAREILEESCEMGDLVNEEIKDVVKVKPKERKIADSDDEDDADF